MTKNFFMLLAAVLLSSANLFAQSNAPLKGDVNEDGVVDVADVVAVIYIIAKSQNDSETTYYWYVGQTDPSTMSSITPIVTDMTSPGWREIGTTVGTYTKNNPLWDGSVNKITVGETKETTYLALPNSTLRGRDGDGNELTALWISQSTKEIDGVTYYIYKTPGTMKIFNSIIF